MAAYVQGCDEFSVEARIGGVWQVVGTVWARSIEAAKHIARADFGRKYGMIRVFFP